MPVIGTAGHVDHGKSTLVRALTGRDPDRWAEEKERGLTIDLGFAWTTLPSGTETGFVDVPGHERFIKNMLAGVDAITVALFVVAADEGWMPQSEEHLGVLDLLGIDNAVIALTRADLVDGDSLELVTLEIDDRLAGTSLEGSPVIATSAPDGRGIDELRARLDAALEGSTDLDVDRPRMWVDRSFTIAGAGTVLTGTLVDGSISIDDVLAVFPDAGAGRIRSIQTHERDVDRVSPGTRAALNVVGLERDDVSRGAMVGRPDEWVPSDRFAAEVRTIRGLTEPLRERGSFHLHLGSGSWPVRLRIPEASDLQGTGSAIVELPERVPIKWGDRFILREVGRQAVVAGGRVLDPAPPRRARDLIGSLATLGAAADPDGAATSLLEIRETESPAVLAAHSGGGSADAALETRFGVYSQEAITRLRERAGVLVAEFHDANPLRAGIPKARLAEQLGIQPDELDHLIDGEPHLESTAAEIRRAGFGVDLDEASRTRWDAARATLDAAGAAPPRRSELGLETELDHALRRDGRLVEVSDDLVYLPETLDGIVATARDLPAGFTVSQFRDAAGITRKHAIPLLEWMDRSGLTVRDGDGRRVVDRAG